MTEIENRQSEIPARQSSGKAVIKNSIKFILLAIILYFITKAIISNWNEIVNYDWSVNIWLLLLSIVCHIFTFAVFSKAWCYIIRGFNYDVPLKYGFKLGYIGNLGRYLPGKVWAIFGMAYLAKKLNIKEEESVASWVIAVIFSLPTAFLISFVTVIIYPELISEELRSHLGISLYVLSVIVLVLSLALIFMPSKTLALFNVFLKLIKRKPINFQVSTLLAFKIYMTYLISWLLFGISFWIFIHAITDNLSIPFWAGAGAYVFAYQVGFVAIFTPGGIGVREFALYSMLEPYFGSVAIGIAVAARLWNIVAEILSAIYAFAVKLPNNERT